jgi:nucleosome assembly protein 1-like 1
MSINRLILPIHIYSSNLGVDIKGKTRETSDDVTFVGPTPNNTPVQAAPIASRVVSEKPSVGGIVEEGEDDNAVEIDMPATDTLSGNIFAGNQRLVSMLQGRLGSLLGKPSGYIESLPAPVHRRINGLKYLQSKHTELEIQFHQEILALEKKFLELYRPLYEKVSIIDIDINC